MHCPSPIVTTSEADIVIISDGYVIKINPHSHFSFVVPLIAYMCNLSSSEQVNEFGGFLVAWTD